LKLTAVIARNLHFYSNVSIPEVLWPEVRLLEGC